MSGVPDENERPFAVGRASYREVSLHAPDAGRFPAPVSLADNANAWGMPPAAARALAGAAGRAESSYPSPYGETLKATLAEHLSVGRETIVTGCGSDGVLDPAIRAFGAPGARLAFPAPTFSMIPDFARVNGVEGIPVPLGDDLDIDADALLATRAEIIYLCSPNNPTGSALTREEIERVYDETGAIVVLDQAYVEFGGYDAIPLLDGRPRLVVLRTYSKAMAMAGLRAGYMLAHPALAAEVHKAKLPYNINFFSEFAAAEVMRARELLQPNVEKIRAERDRLAEELQQIPGIRVFPTAANFLLFRVESPAITHTEVFDRLLEEHGVLVRDVSKYPMLERCLRVNAGTPAEDDVFLNGLRSIMTEVDG